MINGVLTEPPILMFRFDRRWCEGGGGLERLTRSSARIIMKKGGSAAEIRPSATAISLGELPPPSDLDGALPAPGPAVGVNGGNVVRTGRCCSICTEAISCLWKKKKAVIVRSVLARAG